MNSRTIFCNKWSYLPVMIILITVLVQGCIDKPKVIEADISNQITPFEFSEISDGYKVTLDDEPSHPSKVFHKVTIEEILPTSKYVYLRVSEGSEIYWIATKKMAVDIGQIWYYRNGLLKTNFESKEYNRTFEKIYLVSSIVPESHSTSEERREIEMHAFEGKTNIPAESNTENNEVSLEAITIKKLVDNQDNYDQKRVTVSGKCTKVNSGIIGRNWIHLKDGSLDDFDLVITTKSQVVVGQMVEMTGIVSLKKDFGAGYYYDILIEDASLN